MGNITAIVDMAMEERSRFAWFLPGTRERAIKAGLMQHSTGAKIDAISKELRAGEIIWRGDDPCDDWS